MRYKTSLLCAFLATTSFSAIDAANSPTFAQASNVNEIFVRVRQREESVADVPGTVNVISQDTIKRAGVERVEDFINLTPGLSLVDAAEAGDTQVNIRGINSSRDAEQSFAFILDGILMTNTAAFNRELLDLQQIEVFKGPQGAIYGRNAAAGAVIMTTRKPGDEFEFRAKATYGEGDNSKFVAGTVSGPIIPGELYASLGGDFRNLDGFYTNDFLGRDDAVDNFKAHNIQGRLLWTPNDDMSVDAKFRYGKIDGSSISFNGVFALSDFGAFVDPTAFKDVNTHEFSFEPNIDPTNNQESFEASLKMDWDLGFATATGWFFASDIKNDFMSDGTSGAFGFFAAEPNCVASAAALAGSPQFFNGPAFNSGIPVPATLVTAAGMAGGASFYGPYTPTACDGYQYQERNQEDFSFEFRLTSPSDQDIRWQVGAYYLTIDRTVGVATGIDPTFLGGTITESFAAPEIEALVHDNFDSSVFAFFGSAEWDLTDTIELGVALRYDREKRKVDNLIDPTRRTSYIDFTIVGPLAISDPNGNGIPWDDGGEFLNPGLNPFFNPNLAADGSIPNQERTFDKIQPKITATWDVTPDITLFANWGIGFKSGGFNNQGSQATINAFINTLVTATTLTVEDSFEKESSSAFEAGFKSSLLGGRVNIEGAGYYTSVTDMQFFEFAVGPFGLLRLVNNIDDVDIFGGEIVTTANITDNLTFYAGANYTSSEIKANTSRPDTVGNESPYTPKYTINAGFQYVQPVNRWGGISAVFRLDFQYVGPTWFHVVQENTRTIGGTFGTLTDLADFMPGVGEDLLTLNLGTADFSMTRRDSYHTLDLRAGFEGENFSVMAFAKNVTDEKILEEVIPAPEFGGSFIHPAARRSVGAELQVFF